MIILITSDRRGIDRLQSVTFKIWKDNVELDMMTYPERDMQQ